MNKNYRLIEHKEHWIIPLQGQTVTRCFLDTAFGIEFWDHEFEITIQIEGGFLFKEIDEEYKLYPDGPTTLGPALSMFQKEVCYSIASKEGRLYIEFSDGSSLSVEADAEYEAWEIVGSRGLRVVCEPGGRLSVWQPTYAED